LSFSSLVVLTGTAPSFFFVMLPPRLFALDLIVRASPLAPLSPSFPNR
jgi:hypothetical protein